nr:DNA mismatch repair protein [Tanacetum cinerariifolium]
IRGCCHVGLGTQHMGRSGGMIWYCSGVCRCYADATLEHSQVVKEDAEARALSAGTSELEKLFKKEDSRRMKVISQFNLGFIIEKLDQDLFIVDQHTVDEKYNYEHFSQFTILNQQPLLSEGECSMMGTYKTNTTDSVCPSRVHAMLASRACRSSVMIGDPLGRNEMQKIVAHLRGSKITMELSTWKTDNASLGGSNNFA